jgi:hypothetical protein
MGGRPEFLFKSDEAEFAHEVDQRLCRALITPQGLVLRDLKQGFHKRHLALLPLHLDCDRLQQRTSKVRRGLAAAGRPALGLREGSPFLNWCSCGGRP